MRTIVLVLLALVGMSLTSTEADAGSWCANYRRGVSNCGYSSFEQCWATVRGLAGSCAPNPFPGTAYGTGAGGWGTPNNAEALSARLLEQRPQPEGPSCERSAFFDKWPFGPRIKPRLTRLRRN